MTTRVQSWLSQMDQDELDFGVHAIHRHRASIVQAVGLECRPDSPLLGAEYLAQHMAAAASKVPAPPAETDYNHVLDALMLYDSDEDDDASEKCTDEHTGTASTKSEISRVENEEDMYLAPLPSEVPPSVSKSNSWSSVSSAFPLTPSSASMKLASFVNSSSGSRAQSRSRASSNASAFYVGEDAPPSPSITMSRQASTYFGTELSSRPTSYASLRKRESTSALPITSSTLPNVPERKLGFPSHKSMGILRTDSASTADNIQGTHTPPPSIASSRQRSRTVSAIFRNAVYLETEDTVAALQQRLTELDAAFRMQTPSTVMAERDDSSYTVVNEEPVIAQENVAREPASHWSPGSSTTSVDQIATTPTTPMSPFSLAAFSRTPRTSFMGPSPLASGSSIIRAEEPAKKSKARKRFTSFMSKITMPSPAINDTFSSDIPPTPTIPLHLSSPVDESSKDFMVTVDSTPAEELSDPFAAMPVCVQGTPGTRSRAGSDAVPPTPPLPSRLSKESTPFPTLPGIPDEPLSPKKSRFSLFHPTRSLATAPLPPPTPILDLEFEPRARRTSSTLSLKSKPSPAFATQKKMSASRPPSPQKSVKSHKKARVGKRMFDVFSRDTFPAPH